MRITAIISEVLPKPSPAVVLLSFQLVLVSLFCHIHILWVKVSVKKTSRQSLVDDSLHP